MGEQQSFEFWLETLKKQPRPFTPTVMVDNEHQAIEMFLENVSYYGDWIEGEGADICLYRSVDGDHLIGCRLPLTKFIGSFNISMI